MTSGCRLGGQGGYPEIGASNTTPLSTGHRSGRITEWTWDESGERIQVTRTLHITYRELVARHLEPAELAHKVVEYSIVSEPTDGEEKYEKLDAFYLSPDAFCLVFFFRNHEALRGYQSIDHHRLKVLRFLVIAETLDVNTLHLCELGGHFRINRRLGSHFGCCWDRLSKRARCSLRQIESTQKYLELEPDDAETKHLLVALRDEPPPPRAPDECIQQLYQRFSSFYEFNVCEELYYEAPQRLYDLVKQVLGDRRGLAVVDLGGGSGLAGLQLKPLAARMTGVDLSPEMITLARARNIYDQLKVAEITRWLGGNQDRFDLMAACDCLIYFGDLGQVVLPAAGRLARGGVLAFTLERGFSTHSGSPIPAATLITPGMSAKLLLKPDCRSRA